MICSCCTKSCQKIGPKNRWWYALVVPNELAKSRQSLVLVALIIDFFHWWVNHADDDMLSPHEIKLMVAQFIVLNLEFNWTTNKIDKQKASNQRQANFLCQVAKKLSDKRFYFYAATSLKRYNELQACLQKLPLRRFHIVDTPRSKNKAERWAPDQNLTSGWKRSKARRVAERKIGIRVPYANVRSCRKVGENLYFP